jgi:hypothetical protein
MTNDTAVFDAMRFDFRAGEPVWTGLVGTPEAMRRDKLLIRRTASLLPARMAR